MMIRLFKSIKLLSKSTLYGRFLVLMLLLMVTVVLASESSYLIGDGINGPKYGGLIIGVLTSFMQIYFVGLLYQLDYPKKIINLMIVYAFCLLIGGLYISSPFTHIVPTSIKANLYSLFHLVMMSVELFAASVILKDIFSAEETKTDHIWGAVVAYFMLVLIMAEVFEIISLQQPGLLGGVYEMGWPNYVQCIMFSLNSVSGIDTVYPDAHYLLKKIGIVANVIGNLFLVVILGRLLSHPIKNRNKPA
jgi:hypothetical protein